jgi:hypothetical protein
MACHIEKAADNGKQSCCPQALRLLQLPACLQYQVARFAKYLDDIKAASCAMYSGSIILAGTACLQGLRQFCSLLPVAPDCKGAELLAQCAAGPLLQQSVLSQ